MIWADYTIPLETIKDEGNIEHNLHDAKLGRLAAAAILTAEQRTNGGYFEDMPADMEQAILHLIILWYDYPDLSGQVPDPIQAIFSTHYRWPGL